MVNGKNLPRIVSLQLKFAAEIKFKKAGSHVNLHTRKILYLEVKILAYNSARARIKHIVMKIIEMTVGH